MLTTPTVKLLNNLASESHSLYTEGGLLYKYSFGHCCAHTDISKINGTVSDDIIAALEFFLSSALNTSHPKSISLKIKRECSALLKSLSNDFTGYQGPNVYLDEDDYSKTLHLVYLADNNYHVIEMFWSID